MCLKNIFLALYLGQLIFFFINSFMDVFPYRPDTQTYIQQMAQQQAEREKSQQSDNRSFLAKYVSVCKLLNIV